MPEELKSPTAPPPPPPAPPPAVAPSSPPARPKWPLYLALGVVVVFTVLVIVISLRPGAVVSTDDAYVAAHYATIAPRISGPITHVMVDDNQQVKAGQVLAAIDDQDYRVALESAQARLEKDRAQVEDAEGTIARQPSIIDETQAQVASMSAQLQFAKQNQKRYGNLATSGAGTMQERQQADTAVSQAQAVVSGDTAATRAAQRQLPILDAQRRAAQALVKADEALVEQAKLNLSYTRILAPIDGIVAQRAVQLGNFVASGTALMALVPLHEVYVEANYRELQLRYIVPGQHVRIHVDAYDVDVDGVVDNIPAASGASFGLIEANNATGNFTKIVQRLPVKVVPVVGQENARFLRVGLSVETYIDTSQVVANRDPSSGAAPNDRRN
jgi:membrane fusion protein, multidrug efflux system